MNTMPVNVILAVFGFVLIYLSGFWLRHTGKPYSAFIFAVHKLIGTALLVFLVIIFYRSTPPGTIGLMTGIFGGLVFIAAIISGGLLSVDKQMPEAISLLHKVFASVTILLTAITLFLW